jgi:lipoate-protein ligase A
MGVDEALLASALRGGPPTLRFYTWEGAWLSLGYGQRSVAAQSAACARVGVGVVRRSTGGRAVLHGGDLTYALAAPASLLPADLRACYGLVAEALLAGLRALGAEAERVPAEGLDPGREAFDCFARAAPDELCAQGRKLVGSAQRRTRDGILQHGSIRVFPDAAEMRAAAGLADGAATSLRELGVRHSLETVRDRLVEAFGAALDARFQGGELEHREREQAARRQHLHAEDPEFASQGLSWASSRVPLAGR